LRLSAKSVSQPAVFFSHKKSASSIFSQPDQPKRTGFACSVGRVTVDVDAMPGALDRCVKDK
jgi:hypothetical protein